MPWDTILQFVIAVMLLVVSAAAHRLNSHMASISLKLDEISKSSADLAKGHAEEARAAGKSSELLLKVLAYLRRQLYFEKYQRKVNRLLLKQMSVGAEQMVDLEAPEESPEDDVGG